MKTHPSNRTSSRPRGFRFLSPLACWVCLGGLALTAAITFRFKHYENERVQQRIEQQANIQNELFRSQLQRYEDALHGLAALFQYSNDVSSTEFNEAAKHLYARYKGIQAIQWIPEVSHEQREAFEAFARENIAPDYRIRERDGSTGTLRGATKHPNYFPILYNYPESDNKQANGYDLARAESAGVLMEALRTGQIVISPQFKLIQGQIGIIMAIPAHGFLLGTPTKGVVQIVFRLHNMLGAVTSANQNDTPSCDTLIVDATAASSPPSVLYTDFADPSHAGDSEPVDPARFITPLTQAFPITIGRRDWIAYYRPSTQWLALQRNGLPFLSLACGILLTLLGTIYVQTIVQRQRHIIRIVKERTEALRATQKQLEEDIAQRQRTELELKETSRQLHGLLKQVPGVVYRHSWGEKVRSLFVSTGYQHLTAAPFESTDQPEFDYLELVHPGDREHYRGEIGRALQTQSPYSFEYRILDATQSVRWVLDRGAGVFDPSGQLLFIEGLVINIDDRRQAEAMKLRVERKLFEQQKRQSLDMLAGGFAHDFNNLLTGILGHATLLRQEIGSQTGPASLINHIERSSLRAAELCRQMLAYAGHGFLSAQITRLDDFIGELLPLAQETLPPQLKIRFEIIDPNTSVLIDLDQMRQAVLNLISNSAEASGRSPGTVVIRIGRQTVDPAYLQGCALSPTLPTGDYAFIEVSDNGCGIEEPSLSQIFDPFFTTKSIGRGLGLATVLGIVRGHQGAVRVTSSRGKGSAFRILLPLAGHFLNQQSGTGI